MSELTPCNYCTLRNIKRRLPEGVIVTTEQDDDGWIAVQRSDEEQPSAWFAELTDHCVC